MWMDEPGDKLYLIEEGKCASVLLIKKVQRDNAGNGAPEPFGELSLLDGASHSDGTHYGNVNSLVCWPRNVLQLPGQTP